MTNEQKAKQLENLAAEQTKDAEFCRSLKRDYEPDIAQAVAHEAKAAILRESAALWREREDSPVRWSGLSHADYKGRILHAAFGEVCDWTVYQDSKRVACGMAPTLDAAKAAAVAWVDAQEGK